MKRPSSKVDIVPNRIVMRNNKNIFKKPTIHNKYEWLNKFLNSLNQKNVNPLQVINKPTKKIVTCFNKSTNIEHQCNQSTDHGYNPTVKVRPLRDYNRCKSSKKVKSIEKNIQ